VNEPNSNEFSINIVIISPLWMPKHKGGRMLIKHLILMFAVFAALK